MLSGHYGGGGNNDNDGDNDDYDDDDDNDYDDRGDAGGNSLGGGRCRRCFFSSVHCRYALVGVSSVEWSGIKE